MNALILSLALLAQPPCTGEPTPCEIALYRAATKVEIQRVLTEHKLKVCEQRLKVKPIPEMQSRNWATLLTTGVVGVVIGVTASVLVAISIQ